MFGKRISVLAILIQFNGMVTFLYKRSHKTLITALSVSSLPLTLCVSVHLNIYVSFPAHYIKRNLFIILNYLFFFQNELFMNEANCGIQGFPYASSHSVELQLVNTKLPTVSKFVFLCMHLCIC